MRLWILVVIMSVASTLSAARLVIRVDYVPQKKQMATRDIVKDNVWRIPVLAPPQVNDTSRFYVVLNIHATTRQSETLYLEGLYAEPRSLLLGTDASLTVVNKEDIPRNLVIIDSEGTAIKELNIAGESKVSYTFSKAGDYKIKDSVFFWNAIPVTVLNDTMQVHQINQRTQIITIDNLSSGSYNLRIYHGTKWIFQEDFTVVGTNAYPLNYIIKNGDVIRNNTTITPLIDVGVDGHPE